MDKDDKQFLLELLELEIDDALEAFNTDEEAHQYIEKCERIIKELDLK